jgi:hypothetical protein
VHEGVQKVETARKIAKKKRKNTGSAGKGPSPKAELDLDDPTALQPSD